MRKQITAVLLCLLTALYSLPVCAEDGADMTALEAAAPANESLPARSAILMEQQSGRVLFEKNADEILPPASITKVMTMLLVMEALDAGTISSDEMVTCTAHAESMGGTQIWFETGEQLSVDDLLRATAISSANDASVALAEHLAGSEEAFVMRMNDRARELGMTNTTFVNASGLDAPGHTTTARDIATMSRELLFHPAITEYSSVWMGELRGGKTQLVNTNKLVRFYKGCTGLKTGTTDGAGSCLSASATRGGLSLVAVTLGSPTSAERFSAARGLLDYGFANYARVPLPALAEVEPVRVRGGVAPRVEVVSEQPEAVVVRAADKDKVKQEIDLLPDVQAPVEGGQLLGRVTVTIDGEKLCDYDLIAADSVAEMTVLAALGQLCVTLFAL